MQMHVFIRRVLVPAVAVGVLGASVAARQAANGGSDPAQMKNPVASSPESIAAGKKTFDVNCASCHGGDAKGAEKNGITLSVIEDQGGKQPPDLTDAQWDHGSTDGAIFTSISKGIGPQFFMTPFTGRISDTDIWNIVNYLKSLAK
jgi:mono/diheme cytochrome c family protein